MLETMASFVLAEHMGGMTFEGSTESAGYARLLHGGRRPLQTRDGWICALPYTHPHWRAFFHAVGRDDIGDDCRVADKSQRNANIRKLYQRLAELILERTTAEWMDLFEQLDIPATPIHALGDLPEHPHLKAVGLFQETHHPTEGPLREIRPPMRFSPTPLSLLPPPRGGPRGGNPARRCGFQPRRSPCGGTRPAWASTPTKSCWKPASRAKR